MNLERFYRFVLRVYPAPYRAARGEEIIGVLLDSAGTRTTPSASETLSLVRHGLTVRLVGTGRHRSIWSRPTAAAATCLSTVLAVMSLVEITPLAGAVVYRLTHDKALVYLSPLLPTCLMWLATFGFVMARRRAPAAALAWAAAVLHLAALLRGSIVTGAVADPGVLERGDPTVVGGFEFVTDSFHWLFPSSAVQDFAFLVPGVALAVLLSVPASVRGDSNPVSRRVAATALLAGVVPAVACSYFSMSQAWATLVPLAIFAVALARARVLLRGGLIVAYTLSYVLLTVVPQGWVEVLPDNSAVQVLVWALIPVAATAIALLGIRRVDASSSIGC